MTKTNEFEAGLTHWVNVAKKLTARYAKTHKGRNALEKKCLAKGFIVARLGEVFKDCNEAEKNKLGIFALDFNLVHRKGGFTYIR